MDGCAKVPLEQTGEVIATAAGVGAVDMVLPPPYQAVHPGRTSATVPSTAIGDGLDVFHPTMNFMTSSLYFQQPSAADINRMAMFQVVNNQGQLLFTCRLNRIPKVGVMHRQNDIRWGFGDYKTEYTVSDTAGRTVLVALADGYNISVTTGETITIGFIDGSGSTSAAPALRLHFDDMNITYTGTTTNGVNTFKIQRPRGANEFVIEYNGALGIMKRPLPCGPITHAKSFGIQFPANEMDPQTKALIFATALSVYDSYFMRTEYGDSGLRGAQLALIRRRTALAVAGLLAFLVIMLVVWLVN